MTKTEKTVLVGTAVIGIGGLVYLVTRRPPPGPPPPTLVEITDFEVERG